MTFNYTLVYISKYQGYHNSCLMYILEYSFGLDAAWKLNLRVPAKVEYVRCATDRNVDHLLISLDYRLQRTMQMTCLDSWTFVGLTNYMKRQPGRIDEESKHGQAGYDEPERPERAPSKWYARRFGSTFFLPQIQGPSRPPWSGPAGCCLPSPKPSSPR